MTDLDLTKLREIAEAATPGDWERVVDNDSRRPVEVSIWSEVASYYPVEAMVIGNPNHMADAHHIAAFDPPTVIALIDEIERLRWQTRWLAAAIHMSAGGEWAARGKHGGHTAEWGHQ